MDENKKDELVPEEAVLETNEEAASEEGVTSEDVSGASELETELEELRDMFQKELDKATEEAENLGDELIQELDEATEEMPENEEEFTGRLCECCGERPCAEEFGEDYPYCEECRNLMKRYPLRWSGVVMTIVMVLAFCFSAYTCANYADSFMSISESAAYYDSGKIMTAINGYFSYLSKADPEKLSMKAVNDTVEGLSESGYLPDAAELILNLFTEDELKYFWNKRYAKVIEKSEILTKSYSEIVEVLNPVLQGESDDYDKAIEDLDALYNAVDENGNPKNIAPVFIEYYKYVVMSIFNKSSEEILSQLEKTAEVDNGDFSWAYLSGYCSVAAKCGNYELAEEIHNKMLSKNKEDVTAYTALATYYRYSETPDPDKMLELCEEAKKNASTGDYSYASTMAVAYLLKGENELALEAIESYMSMGNNNVQTYNLYALCALCNGDKTTYTSVKNLLSNNGYEISKFVEKYNKGKMTIEEVLTDKEGDI